MSLRKISLFVPLLLLTSFSLLPAQVKQRTRHLVPMGSGQLETPSQATGNFDSPNAQGLEVKPDLHLEKPILHGTAPMRPFPTPVVAGKPVVGPGPGDIGFNGLDHADQRLADNGNQFSVEPPDQAMGVNATQVFESVNDAFAVYDHAGNILAGPTSSNKFFGLPSAIQRPAPFVFGPELTDPRIIFDPDTQRWFATVAEIDIDPKTGAFLHSSHILLAVSTTSDATGVFNFFSIDVTDPRFGLCPCIGDQPLLGANADGIYISTNQFSFTNGFQTALVLATDKHRLAANAPGPLIAFQGLTQAEGPGFSVHPAMNTNVASSNINGGTEFFLSSLDFNGTADDRITVWALTNTSSLRSNHPSLNLNNVVIQTEIYGQPPNAIQKAGPTPLGTVLGFPEELLASNDDRMNEVYFSQGKLFGAVNTLILGPTAPRVGIAWFEIQPSTTIAPLTAHVVNQGYVAVNNQNLLFPSMAINSDGEGVMGFSLSGPDFFPSFAYILMSTAGSGSKVHLVAPGVAPEDGFSGYPPFGTGVARWGDYGFAAVEPDGDDVWVAGEYIPNRPRTPNANWGTWIERVVR